MDGIMRGPEPAWWSLLLCGLAALLLGAFLIASPAKTLLLLVTFIGAYWFVRGVVQLIDALGGRTTDRGWRLFAGIVSILVGGFVLAYPAVGTVLVPLAAVIALGLLAFVSGVAFIAYGVSFGGGAATVLGILDLVFGVILLASPYVAVLAVPYVLGAFAIIDGIVLVVVAFALRSHQHGEMHRMAPV